LGFVRSLVVRSTEIEDDGGVALRTAVERYVSTEKVAAKGLRDEDIVIEAAGGSPARPVGRPVILRPLHDRQVSDSMLETALGRGDGAA
jgi:hypothetical protein